jgi:hypothetical protein
MNAQKRSEDEQGLASDVVLDSLFWIGRSKGSCDESEGCAEVVVPQEEASVSG